MQQGAPRPRGTSGPQLSEAIPTSSSRHPCRNFLYKYRHNLYVCIPVTERIPLPVVLHFAFLSLELLLLLLLSLWVFIAARALASCGRWGLCS